MFKRLLFLTAAIVFAGLVFVSCSSDDKSTDPAPDKVFKVLSPNGGEIYQKGEEVVIKYKNELEGDVALFLYKAGEFLYTINAAETSKDSSLWVVPTTLATGTDYKIMIESLTDSTKFDYSDAGFTVAPAGEYIIVNSSNGGDIWLKGETKQITWFDNIAGSVNVLLFKNGIQVLDIFGTPQPSDGSQGWTIPGTLDDGADYSIQIVSTDNPSLDDFSDNFFCLATNDNTQNIIGDWNVNYTWKKGIYSADFYSDHTWKLIEGTDTTSGTWNMAGNGIKFAFDLFKTYYLGIVDGDGMVGTMLNDSGTDAGTWFADRVKPLVLTPNGGQVWLRGTTQTITWDTAIQGDVVISLADSTGIIQNIATVSGSLGTYEWSVPNTITPNADYKIRISKTINSEAMDESDNYFCISANETVNVLGEWESGFILTKGNMTLVLNGDGTGTFTTWSTWNGNWTLTGNGLKFVTDYAFTNYWIAIVDGDKLKGTFIDSSNKGIWDGRREIEVAAPNGGNVYQPADVVSITWTENLSAENAVIDLYENDVLSRNIGTVNINNFTSFNWTVPSNLVTSTKYKIRMASAVNSDIYDESDAYFTVNGVNPTPALEDENFDDGLAQNWSSVIGNWSVVDSVYTATSDSLTVGTSFYGTSVSGNYSFEAKIRKTVGTTFNYGIVVNGDHTVLNAANGDWNNCAMLVITADGYYNLVISVDGAWAGTGWNTSTALVLGLGEWNTIKLIVNNSTHDYHIFINGQYIQTVNDASFDHGDVGLKMYDTDTAGIGEFDNVKLSQINKSTLNGINIKRTKLVPCKPLNTK